MQSMNNLSQIISELLTGGKVTKVIGYVKSGSRSKPFISSKAEDAGKFIMDETCVNNLAVYLTKDEIMKQGKVAVVAKGCDIRAIVALIQENQIKRDDVYIIGVNCQGVKENFDSNVLAAKCTPCKVKTPAVYDVLIEMEKPKSEPSKENKKEEIEKISAMTDAERFEFFEKEFEKCIKCYACRQACPLCYCEQCIADKSVPRWIESSATRRGNMAWNIIRAFHLSGRCIGCNECERVCPQDIPLSLLNKKMSMVAFDEFGYEAGMDMDAPTLTGNYDIKDNEDFIQ